MPRPQNDFLSLFLEGWKPRKGGELPSGASPEEAGSCSAVELGFSAEDHEQKGCDGRSPGNDNGAPPYVA